MYIGLQSSHLRTLLVSLTGISKFCTLKQPLNQSRFVND
jgi:hypothetical protein